MTLHIESPLGWGLALFLLRLLFNNNYHHYSFYIRGKEAGAQAAPPTLLASTMGAYRALTLPRDGWKLLQCAWRLGMAGRVLMVPKIPAPWCATL